MAKLLTAVAVERIKPDPERRLEVPDKLLPGLYLVVQPSGRRSFALRTRINDKTVKLTLGAYPAFKIDEARAKAREELKRIHAGEDPRVARATSRANTVGAIVDEFITRYAKPRLKAWREVDVRLKRDLVRAYGDRPVASLGRADLVRLLDELSDRGVRQGANRLLAPTRRMLGWAVERGIVESNVALGIKPPAKEVARDRVLDDDELAAVWRVCAEMDFPFGPLFRARSPASDGQMSIRSGPNGLCRVSRRRRVDSMRSPCPISRSRCWALCSACTRASSHSRPRA